MDRTVGETFYVMFTTRAVTGVPTTLAGTPVVSAYEDSSLTQITAGITLGVDHDSVTGLNLLTIVATGANGYEAGKDYNLVITTGTVNSVSAVGEVVGTFSLGLSAAFTRLGAPAGASVSADIADVPTVAEFEARTLVAASYFDPAADTVATVTTLTNLPAITANWLTAAGIAASALDGKGDWNTVVPDAAGVAPTAAENATQVWEELTATARTAGTYGQLIKDDIDATISSRATSAKQDTMETTLNAAATAAALATVDTVVDGIQTDLDNGTDGLGALLTAINAQGASSNLLQNTTIATLSSQTSFTLTAGSADDDAYNNQMAVVTDQSTATQKAIGLISDYTGSTKTVTLDADPGVFTMATGDTIDIIAVSGSSIGLQVDGSGYALLPTATQTSIDAIETDTGTTLDGKIDTIDGIVDSILVDTGTTIPATITTAQNDLDIITGADGVNLLTATQASIDAIEADTNELQTDDVPGLIATLDAVVDTVKADTAAILIDTADIQPNYATATNLATVDTVVDAIKVKTDQMVFTKTNELDSNTLSINGAGLVGDGNATPWDGA